MNWVFLTWIMQLLSEAQFFHLQSGDAFYFISMSVLKRVNLAIIFEPMSLIQKLESLI